MMKIAVATIDGISLSQHFGQSKGFVVFDVEDSTVRSREFRRNEETPHNQGICGSNGENPQGAHSNAGIFELLNGCSVVLCGGIGGGAVQAMQANEIKPVILPGERSADDAMVIFLNGNLPATEAGYCHCEH
jgi:predicted Fe-Mo cluster-binding NifX family protein